MNDDSTVFEQFNWRFFKCIYRGKTSNYIPAVSFPSEFLVAVNEKNYNNVIKILKYIIIPYVQPQRNTLDLDSNHWAILILDDFKGQITVSVRELIF